MLCFVIKTNSIIDWYSRNCQQVHLLFGWLLSGPSHFVIKQAIDSNSRVIAKQTCQLYIIDDTSPVLNKPSYLFSPSGQFRNQLFCFFSLQQEMSERLIGNGAKFICLKWISVFYSISEPSPYVCANTLGWNKPHSPSHLILSLSIINPHGVDIIQHKADKLKKTTIIIWKVIHQSIWSQ